MLLTQQKVLTLDLSRSLVRLAPTKDEIDMIQQYKVPLIQYEFSLFSCVKCTYISIPKGEKDKLGVAEKFFIEMMTISRLAERLSCFVYKKEFNARVDELRAEIKDCNIAMHEVRTSNKLRRIMEVRASHYQAFSQMCKVN